TITNPAPFAGDCFGYSVAGVGTNYFVVGAHGDDAGATDAGSVYLYDLNGTLLMTITNPAPAAYDVFGYSVAGVGTNRFVVGACYDYAGASAAGSAYLYDLNGTLLATLANPDPDENDYFGDSVAGVDSDHFVVGATAEDAGTEGSVYLYDLGTTFQVVPGLAADSVAPNAIGAMQMAPDAVTSSAIATGAVGADEIAVAAVSNTALAANAVTGDKIADGTITANDLDLASVDGRYVKKSGDTMTGSLTNQQTITAARFVNSNNDVADENSFAPGGIGNTISNSATYCAISGGLGNLIGTYADKVFIGGGESNSVAYSADYVVIAGGLRNGVSTGSDWSVVGGGYENRIGGSGGYLTIAGGASSEIGTNCWYSTISGGRYNVVGDSSGYSVIAGGRTNVIGKASGYSFIAGGYLNAVGDSAQYAFAAGRQAKANHQGAFVWGDSTAADIASTNANSVTMRAYGGFRLFTAAGVAAQLVPGSSSWSSLSDRNAKENFEPINTSEILEKVAALPITAWNYKDDPDRRRYIGPVSQDFHAAFGLGSDTSINTLDTDGVALAAIQALAKQNAELKEELNALKARLDALEKSNSAGAIK
ncbi:MAG: tail fiber domain-containing protein, partial [Pontiellaceae bacterium]|nr:tail fiber domain-containing protein [Pontiellaceae bacterium]